MDSLNPFFYPPESFLEDLESQSRASDLLGLMEGRRIRRFGRGSQSSRTLLPLRLTRLTNAVSCWYAHLSHIKIDQNLSLNLKEFWVVLEFNGILYHVQMTNT